MSELVVGSLKGLAANGFVIDVASGSKLVQPGSILQVVSTFKNDTTSTASTSFTDLTGMAVSIAPVSSSSKILVFFDLALSHSVNQAVVYVNLRRDTTTIAQPSGGVTAGTRWQTIQFNSTFDSPSFSFLDTPSTTSAVSYNLQWRVATGTGFLNRAGTNVDSTSVSTITAMEVAG